MPFIPQEEDAGVRAPNLLQQPAPPEGSLLAAAFRQENTIVSAYNYVTERSGFTYDPSHNPLDLIKETKFEQYYLDRFVDSRSEAETRQRMARIEREEEDRKLLDSSGLSGTIAQIVAGTLDPTLFIPLGTIYKGVRTGRAALRSSLATGAATGAVVAGQEAILYGSQELRTAGESTANVAMGTIIGGLLGGAISHLSSRELGQLNDVMEGFRREVNTDMTSTAPVGGIPQTMGRQGSADANPGFKTAKGSTYTVQADGTTIRNKAARNDPGHERDSGIKPATAKTYYLDAANSQALAPPASTSWRIIDHGDGTVSLATKNADGRWGIASSQRNVPVSTTPEVGKHPLELWGPETVNGLPGFKKLHLGNDIIEVWSGGTGGGSGAAQSAGAASNVRRGLTLESALGAEKVAAPLSPVTRLQTSPFEASKATVRDLADAGLAYKENFEGVPTSEGGTVETRIKMRRGPMIEAIGGMDDAYARYFFDKTDVSTWERQSAGTRAGWASVTGQLDGKLTAREFREEIGKAMRRGDEHPIPQVAEAAKAFRAKVFDPLKDEAVGLKLLPKDVGTLGAESYLTRVYNRERIIGERDKWSGILRSHMERKHEAETRTFEAKQSTRIARLEQDVADLSLQREGKAQLADQLDTDLAKLRADNPEIAAIERNVADLRERARAAREADDEDAAKSLREQANAAVEEGGDAYADFVQRRNTLSARQRRLRQALEAPVAQSEDDLAKAVAAVDEERLKTFGQKGRKGKDGEPDIPNVVGTFTKQRLDELGEVRAPFEARETEIKAARDEELADIRETFEEMTRGSEAEVTVAGEKKTLRSGADLNQREIARLQNQRLREETRIKNKYDRQLSSLERERKSAETKFNKVKDAERKALAKEFATKKSKLKSDFEAAQAVAAKEQERVATLRDRIDSIKQERPAGLADYMPEELPSLVDEITNKILGEGALRLPGFSIVQGPKGPLKARVLDVPDQAIEEFLETDIEKVARIYTHSMSGDIELAKKFGSVTMQDQLVRLTEEFNAKTAAATSKKERVALERQYRNDLRDVEALRDRIRGNYAVPSDPDGLMYRAGRAALNLNYLARLGGVTISSLPDAARPIMRYGLNAFRDGWVPFIQDLQTFKLAAREVRLTGTALEMVRDQRALELADVMDDFGRNSKFERGVQYAADRFSMMNLMSPWNGAMKSMAGVITMANVIRAVEAVAKGKATKSQIGKLAQGGIDDVMAKRIWAATEATGDKVNGVHLPNTEKWTDLKAIEAFRAVINREVETMIVTPGLEKPLWMSSALGKVIGQFKTFALVSTQRVTLAGIQQKDAAALSGVMTALAIGAMTAHIKNQLRPQPQEWTWAQWAQEAADQSGLFGILMEINATAEKVSKGRVGLSMITGKEISRYASRNAIGALLGPTFDAAGDAVRLGGIGSEDWSRSDTHAIRKILPFQNLFYLRKLFDSIEENVQDGALPNVSSATPNIDWTQPVAIAVLGGLSFRKMGAVLPRQRNGKVSTAGLQRYIREAYNDYKQHGDLDPGPLFNKRSDALPGQTDLRRSVVPERQDSPWRDRDIYARGDQLFSELKAAFPKEDFSVKKTGSVGVGDTVYIQTPWGEIRLSDHTAAPKPGKLLDFSDAGESVSPSQIVETLKQMKQFL